MAANVLYDRFRIRCPGCGELAVGPLDREEFGDWLTMCAALMNAHLAPPVNGLSVKGEG